MKLKKYKLGELIELVEETNSQGKYGPKDVRGMTITKEIIPTKADVANTDLRKFLVVHPDEFVFNPRTHGKKIGFGYNNTNECFLISWNNIAFRVKSDALDIVIPTYLFLHFNRKEWDREACFCSWGSSTELFSWNAICDMKLTLPSIEQQRKYVDIYLALQSNLAVYQSKVEDLKMVCDGYIEELRRNMECKTIEPYIREVNNRNVDFKITNVQGVESTGNFTETRANTNGLDFHNYKVVSPNQFAYNPSRINLGSIALRNEKDGKCIVSPMYIVFEVKNTDKLMSNYLLLWLSRSEFLRSTLFYASGSVRDTFDFSEMKEVAIPIPDIKVQQEIVNIHKCYIERQRIADALKEQIKNICPVLIRGSLT
jgi:type I restriction enzyme S subunit